MKGMDPIQQAFVSLVFVMMFIAFAANPLQSAIDAAIDNDARLNANFLTSAANLLQASPSGTSYMLNLPNAECQINITEKDVTYIVLNKNRIYSLDVIENFNRDFASKRINVLKNVIFCKKGAGKIERKGDIIQISDV
jgi:hypothetical protein